MLLHTCMMNRKSSDGSKSQTKEQKSVKSSASTSCLNNKTHELSVPTTEHSNCNIYENNDSDTFNILNLLQLNDKSKLHCPRDSRVCGKPTLTGLKLQYSRIQGLIVKKLLCYIRSYSMMCLQIIVPMCMMWSNMTLLERDLDAFIKLNLTTTSLRGTTVISAVVGSENSTAAKLDKIYRETVQLSGGESLRVSPEELTGSLQYLDTGPILKAANILIGAIFTSDSNSSLSQPVNVTAVYNIHVYQSEAISVATASKAIHSYCLNTNHSKGSGGHHVDFSVLPLPLVGIAARHHGFLSSQHFCLHSAATLLASMAFLTSVFALPLLKEKQTGSRHLQLLSGADPLIYHFGNVISDMFIYIWICVLIFSPLYFLNKVRFLYEMHGTTLMLMLLSYGLASLPLVYLLQLPFTKPMMCLLVIFSVRNIAGASFLLLSSEGKRVLGHDFTWLSQPHMEASLYILSPSYNIFTEFYRMCMGTEYTDNQGHRMVFQLITPFICWSTILTVVDSNILYLFRNRVKSEYRRLFPISKKPSQIGVPQFHDADVQNEYKRVSAKSFKGFIVMKRIVGIHEKRTIIDGITVALSQGKCFCFLGREKSGKSTLLRILTGQMPPTSGTVLIDNEEIILPTVLARMGISYCPQTAALIDVLTGKEMLILYGRLRGVQSTLLQTVAQKFIHQLRMQGDKLCVDYSQADRKKLSIAIALVGEPRIVVLDEPTAGLDYVDKKTVWCLLSCTLKYQRTLVVASSSTEECSVLGGKKSRMAILSEGRMVCLTSLSVLNTKYISGYTVIVQFQADENGIVYSQMPFLTSVVEVFTNVEIIADEETCRLHFLKNNLNLGKLFAVLEDGVRFFHVSDYSVQKTSLAHILVSLSMCPEEEYIEIPPGASSSFDRWPPKGSLQQQQQQQQQQQRSLETHIH